MRKQPQLQCRTGGEFRLPYSGRHERDCGCESVDRERTSDPSEFRNRSASGLV
jgi:hypothetical protein